MNGPSQKLWLTRKEAAAHLMALGYLIAPRTLERLAAKREGPPYRRMLYKITAYNRSELETWAQENCVEVRPAPRPAKIKAVPLMGALSRIAR